PAAMPAAGLGTCMAAARTASVPSRCADTMPAAAPIVAWLRPSTVRPRAAGGGGGAWPDQGRKRPLPERGPPLMQEAPEAVWHGLQSVSAVDERQLRIVDARQQRERGVAGTARPFVAAHGQVDGGPGALQVLDEIQVDGWGQRPQHLLRQG